MNGGTSTSRGVPSARDLNAERVDEAVAVHVLYGGPRRDVEVLKPNNGWSPCVQFWQGRRMTPFPVPRLQCGCGKTSDFCDDGLCWVPKEES